MQQVWPVPELYKVCYSTNQLETRQGSGSASGQATAADIMHEHATRIFRMDLPVSDRIDHAPVLTGGHCGL